MEPGGLNVERVRASHHGEGCLHPAADCQQMCNCGLGFRHSELFHLLGPEVAVPTSCLDRFPG